MQEQFVKLKASMASSLASTPSPQNATVYRKQMEQIKGLREGYKDLQGNYVNGFNEMSMATGRFHVETVRTLSASQQLSKAIKDQKLTFGQLFSELRKPGGGGLKEVAREQTALRQAMSMQWQGSQLGKNSVDMYVPKGLGSDLDNVRMKYGVINEALRSAATQTVNWGKNMQWAGRQIMVGLGVPIALVGAAMGKAAYNADQQLVRVTKVYDAQAQNIADADVRQTKTAQELSGVRNRSMQLGISMAKQYGQSLHDTLSLEADLAATGKTGNELMQQTSEVTRIATLGELDHQKALDMSITLGTVFNQNAKEMGDSFNYINAIENATSLSTQDFAEALPRAGSALHGLGMNLQEIGVLLVAMKAGGVDAAEGANALKSATSRLVKPTQQAKDLMWGYHINLEAIVNNSGGNLLHVLEALGKEMTKLNPVQKQQAMATIFGTFQFNKLNTVMSQLADTTAGYGDQQNQVARAFKTMAAGSESWAQTAAQEQAQMANSASGKFKRAVESIKAEMATMGQAFLGPVTAIINGVAGLIHWIGKLPKVVKMGLTGLATVGLVAGPIIMLIGLMGNLMGNVMKLAGWFANLGLRFSMMSKEERANEIMARRAASAFDSQESSVAKLTIELQNMIATMEKQYALQAEMNAQATATVAANERVAASEAEVAAAATTGAMPIGGMGKRKNSGSRNTPQGRETLRANQAAAAEAQAARQMEAAALANSAGATTQIEENAAKTKMSMGKVAGYMGVFAMGAFALHGMADSSGGVASNLMNAAMFVSIMAGSGAIKGVSKLVGLVGTGLTKGVGAVKLGMEKVGDGARYAYAQGKYFEGTMTGAKMSVKGVGNGLKALGSSMLGFFGPGGLVILGLTAAVSAFWAINKAMEAAEQRQININNSTHDWSEVLGYTEKIYGNMADAASKGAAQSPYQARRKEVDELTSKNKDLVNSLKDAANASDNFASVYSAAMGEALKVKLSGGNKAQAKEAFQVALQAAGLGEADIKQLSVKFDNVNLDNASEVVQQISNQISDALGSVNMNDIGASTFRKEFADFNPFGNGNEVVISWAAEDAGKKAGAQFGLGLANATSADEQKSMIAGMSDKMKIAFADQFTDLATDSDIKGAINTLGIKNMQDLDEARAKAAEKVKHTSGATKKAYQDLLDSSDMGEALNKYDAVWNAVMGSVQSTLGLTDKDMAKLKKSGYANAVMLGIVADKTDTTASGIGKVGDAAQGATSFMDGFTAALAQGADGLDLTGEQITQGMQSAFSQAQGYALAAADRIWSEQAQAEQDAIQASGDRKKKALDDQSKTTDKYYDNQGKALDKAIKAEKDAFDALWDAKEKKNKDDIQGAKDAADKKIDAINKELDALKKGDDERQKLFEREKTRLERMAQLANNNIDFNAALNSGNLDEAAKVFNSNQATVASWDAADQQAAMDEASKKKQDALEGKIKQIEDERDAKVKALEAVQEAEKKARDAAQKLMEDAQQKRKDDLADAKQKAQDKLTAEKAAQDASLANALKDNQKTYEDKKIKLDMEITAIKASVPRTLEEYNKQVEDIKTAYAKYGVDLKSYGDEWSGTIGFGLSQAIAASSNSIQNDIKWAQIGKYISDQVANGVGVNIGDLQTFLTTGKWPTKPKNIDKDLAGNVVANFGDVASWRRANFDPSQYHAKHIGGVVGGIGFSQKDRTGVPANASLYHSEAMAILKKGEFVVNKESAQKNAGILAAINSTNQSLFGGEQGGWAAGNIPTVVRHQGGSVTAATAGTAGVAGMMFAAAAEQRIMDYVLNSLMGGQGGMGPGRNAGFTGQVTQSISSALAFGRQQQGKPYIWGGAGPDGQDCSGFISVLYNWLTNSSPGSSKFPWGRDWTTSSFEGGREFGPWKKGTGANHAFRIGVAPGSHMAGTLGGINVESGSGHGPRVGGNALGAEDKSFRYHYYLPQADVPGLRTGGLIKYDNTLANLHKDETVLTAPLTKAFSDNVANGFGSEYNINVNFHGPVNSDLDVEKAVQKAIEKVEAKNGRKRVIK